MKTIPVLLLSSALAGLGACSTSPSSGGDVDGGVLVDTGSPDVPKAGCASAADCDDGFSCTVDVCTGGSCSHSVGPNSGPTACPAGSFCVQTKGCVKAKACATNDDCKDDDACTVNERCDPASSLCIFEVLDKDGDKHPPPVCGGGDCNDGDKDVYPGAPERCNGRDDNCNGSVDDGATCSSALETCRAGVCECPPENTCGTRCTDRQKDSLNCGACGNVCPSSPPGGTSQICVGGVCTCPPKEPSLCTTAYGSLCVDFQTDWNHCGSCKNQPRFRADGPDRRQRGDGDDRVTVAA